MAKNYLLQFQTGGIPSLITGFSPTFIVFKTVPGGTNATPPGITEIPTTTGLFYFTFGPTNSVSFIVDGGSSLVLSSRYISGMLDPIQAVDEAVTNLGTTLVAAGNSISVLGGSLSTLGSSLSVLGSSLSPIGTSFLALDTKIGTTASSFGSTSSDPTTIYGYLKRALEFNEGNSTFTKSIGIWDVYSRGSSTLLTEKALSDSGGIVSKS